MFCQGFKKDNTKCTRKPIEGTDFCWQHKEKSSVDIKNESKEKNNETPQSLLVCFKDSCTISSSSASSDSSGSSGSSSNKSSSFSIKFDEIFYDPKKQNHIKSRSTYMGNQLIKIEIYWKNGNILQEQNFKNNKLNGDEFIFYQNGNKRSEYNYIGGNKDGDQIEWYLNGNQRSRTEYKDGKIVSESKNIKSGKMETEFQNINEILGKGDNSVNEEESDESQSSESEEDDENGESENEESENEENNENEEDDENGFDEEERNEEEEQEEEQEEEEDQ